MLKFERVKDMAGISDARNIVESEWPAKERSTFDSVWFHEEVKCDILDDHYVRIYLGLSKQSDTPVVTGSLYLLPTFRNGFSSVAQIENLVVLTDCRGCGYGKEMVDFLIGEAKQLKQVYKVVLNCSDENIAFYERCGFMLHEHQMRLDIW